MIPTIDSLHKEKSEKDNSRKEIYNIVLKKCTEKIVYTNKRTDKTFIIFEVPQVLIGYPSYDLKSCILFLMKRLSTNGYILEFIEPFYLYIDWGSRTKPDRTDKKDSFSRSQIEFVFEDTLKKAKKKKK
jgi:hypothetical protein